MIKNRFLFPTKKVFLGSFFLLQLIPAQVIFVMIYLANIDLDFSQIFKICTSFQPIIISVLIMWELKPQKELDERELNITLKWKSRILDCSQYLTFVQIVCFLAFLDIDKMYLMLIFIVPQFILLVGGTALMKKEIGYFYFTNSELP